METLTITFLGTAAAEGIPAIFCNCPTCVAARKSRGKDLRTRSQILIGDDLLVDFPPESYIHSVQYGFDLSRVKTVLFTHSHMDHCAPADFVLRGAPYAQNMVAPALDIYGNADVLDVFAEQTRRELRPTIAPTLRLHLTKPYDTFAIDDYTVTALPACHNKNQVCLVYLIQAGGKAFLQLNDTGVLPDEVFDRLAARNVHLDAVAFDCTYGNERRGAGARHMGLLDAVDTREQLRARNLVDGNTQYILTHISHNAGLSHAALVDLAAPLNFTVAYDGLKLLL